MSKKKHDEAFVALVNASRARIEELTVPQVMEMQARNAAFVFIDVREDREFAVDRCSGSIHIGKGVIERDIAKHVQDRSQRIVLYCGGGYRSALAADNLVKMGYTNVASMDGGIRHWRAQGGALDRPETTE